MPVIGFKYVLRTRTSYDVRGAERTVVRVFKIPLHSTLGWGVPEEVRREDWPKKEMPFFERTVEPKERSFSDLRIKPQRQHVHIHPRSRRTA